MDGAARPALARVSADPGKPTFRDIFAIGEFRALWLAQLLSVRADLRFREDGVHTTVTLRKK